MTPFRTATSTLAAAAAAVVVVVASAAPAALAGPGPAAPTGAAGTAGQHWVAVWGAAPSDASRGSDITDSFDASAHPKHPLSDETVRMVFTPSRGGSTVRVHLSNLFGTTAVTFARTTLARQASGASITGPATPVTFRGGQASITAEPGKDVVSDPVSFAFSALETLAASVHVSGDAGLPTEHYTARQTSYLTPAGTGDHTRDVDGRAFSEPTTARPFLAGLDVKAARPSGAVVAFGDSITDGYQGDPPPALLETAATLDTNRRWPDDLARRLNAQQSPLTVVNLGISGNRVLRDGTVSTTGSGRDTYGTSALHRTWRVLHTPGVTTVILLEGINDLGQSPQASPADVIAGYQALIARFHQAGLRVLQGTLTPSGGAAASYGTAVTNQVRLAVNTWIRTHSPADAVIDFDAAVRDPAQPSRIAPAYDGGDHLHFNLAGYQAMARAVPLNELH